MEENIKRLIKAIIEISDMDITETTIGLTDGTIYKVMKFNLPVETIEELREYVEEQEK